MYTPPADKYNKQNRTCVARLCYQLHQSVLIVALEVVKSVKGTSHAFVRKPNETEIFEKGLADSIRKSASKITD